ncbi:MAG: ORC-CDC6 family AAA ATPase [Bordetella sp.]|uniref:ORC-CDC6 family AAA ATPase n=1 Tax=Bordetella sp. TaxID=28081 RepID=UPI003F7BBF21
MHIDASMLARTRAEEHSADVWGEFFIPPYFDRLELTSATRSVYITGKRGCGKTMLLKYFDYHTAFSTRRKEIPPDAINHVGIYWRVDTQFCSSLKHRGIEDNEWSVVFESYFGLVIATELLHSVETIAESAFPGFNREDLAALCLSSATDYLTEAPTGVRELAKYLESLRRRFTTWVSNVKAMNCPTLPPGREFILSLIEDLQANVALSTLAVFVYVDEIENLVPYQRHVLNSFLKHSQRPLIVSFTSKEHPSNNDTTGAESISATHDYRLLDLDYLLTLSEAAMPFFAEVFLGNLDIAAGRSESERLEIVRSHARLAERQTPAYQKAVLADMRQRFPNMTDKEVAIHALQQTPLRKGIYDRISKALKDRRSSLTVDDFLFEGAPAEAIVTLPALLNRETLHPDKVLAELKSFAVDQKGQFSSSWVHNNLFGALLELYRPFGRECPLYSGFETLCTMSNNNLRNFLILCYKTLEVAELRDQSDSPYAVEIQCRAAYDASEQLIKEIRTFGRFGEPLRMFVLRLGNIFRALQASPPMSEPEQNQFTINSGDRSLNKEESDFIAEALRYGILVEQLETKSKAGVGQDIVDYQLNPIYAPYFQISYRRKRKIEISVEQFHTLVMGNENEYKELARGLARQLSDIDAQQLGLQLS